MKRKFLFLQLILICFPAHLAFAQEELNIFSASASSSLSASPASKAIDKNLITYWQGARKRFWWLRLDLGKSLSLTKISIFWHKDQGATNYRLEGSSDGRRWRSLAANLSSSGGTGNPHLKEHSLSGAYRFLRIYIHKAQKSSPIIYEVKTFGQISPDTTAPTGSIQINQGALHTNSTSVTLSLFAQDNPGGLGLSQMQFSNDGTAWSTPELYATVKSWTLSAADGNKTVYVKYSDKAGNWSTAYADTIILDTIAPNAPTIAPLISPANQNAQVIKGEKGVDVESITVDCPTAVVGNIDYPSPTSWLCQLTNLTSGDNLISVTARDAAGNKSQAILATIFLDIIPPQGAININNDTEYTSSVSVTLSLSAQDNEGGSGLSQMQFSSDNALWSVPENYAPEKEWTLASGDGTKTVYVQFSDGAGNWSNTEVKDFIILDTTAPFQPVVKDDGEGTSLSGQLHANWLSSDSLSPIVEYQYKITQDSPAGQTIVDWTSAGLSSEITYTGLSLTPGKIYYFAVKAKNAAGLWSEIGYSDGIKVIPPDVTAPTGEIKINADQPYTNLTSVILNLSAHDNPEGSGVFQMQFSNDSLIWSAVEAYQQTKDWLLPSGDGQKRVYVQFLDNAGNWSAVYSDAIGLDTIAPEGSISINNAEASTESLDVVLNLSAADTGSGMGQGAQMQFSHDGADWSVAEDYATSKSWRLSDGFGTKTVYVRFKDAMGNWTQVLSDTIELVNAPKERIHIYLNGQRIAMEENGKKYFFHNDHLGSSSVVTDEAGQLVKYLEYQPFGETKLEEGPLSLNQKFTGKELDDSTGLYDYGARLYEPKLGRFISPDTIEPELSNPQSLNRYSYTLNNPLRYIDPTGEEPLTAAAIWATIDTASDIGTTAYDVYQFLRDPSKENLASVGIDLGAVAFPFVSATMLKGGIMSLSQLNRASKAAKTVDKAGNIIKAERQLERAKDAKTFSRFMTKAETEAVKKTKFLRGGEEGKTFFTTNKYQTVKSAKSKLALRDSPEVRLDFKIKNQPNVKGYGIVKPKYGEPGGGIQFKTKDKVQVEIIRKRKLR